MMLNAEYYLEIFQKAIADYHFFDSIDYIFQSPYPRESIEDIFYQKSGIDTVQWHIEDIIRMPDIDSMKALELKRRIDKLNQQRTDIVEEIDHFFFRQYERSENGQRRHNSESLGWAFDRLSILELKNYHINAELDRPDITDAHIENCSTRKMIIEAQKRDLLQAINWLMEDLDKGVLNIKLYKQLKMYNDPAFNPALYSSLKQ